MATSAAPRTTPLLVGGAAVLLLALAVALFGGGDAADGFDPATIAVPEVTGVALPAGGDVAGLAAPRATGDDLLGDATVTAPVPGTPTLLVFLAHWCPTCDAEVPVLRDWVADGRLPDGVELVGVATGIDANRPSYPPTTWLDGHDWAQPTLVDVDDRVAAAYGVTGYPTFVAVAADGTVLARGSGAQDGAALDALASVLAAG